VDGDHCRNESRASHAVFNIVGHARLLPSLDRPLISAVVPVRNGMPWIEAQLRSLAAQQCSEPWEVVIADNGSTDGSRELARTWAEDHANIRVVDASAVSGPAAARNAGVRVAEGSLLAFCDADDVVHPGWLEACQVALERSDVVAGVFDFWSLNGAAPSPCTPAATRQLGFLPFGLGANLAVRRNAFEQVGGFAEDLFTGEDIDLCWRLQLQGFRFEISSEAIVARRDRPGFRQVFRQALSYGRCGPVLFSRYRSQGAARDPAGAIKAWAWLAASLPGLTDPQRRIAWARTAGVRLGRLEGSVKERVLFP
jgi:glycosyltransferase involved in cell wall biosynthesis